ncbi:MAG TPA: hypothetical protein VKA95_10780 [Nitrososphaeraceae archaeon]|nr:hypothetical protein [Nitrososphaeraceae archaeon]
MRKHKIGTYRKCLYFNQCGSEEIHDGKGWKIDWFHHYKEGLLCQKCYARLIRNPKRTKEYIKKYNDRQPKDSWKKYRYSEAVLSYRKRRLRFKDKRVSVKNDFRTYQCQICGNKKGDEYINSKGKISKTKKIDMHHIQYHEEDPLKDTIEVCRSCHSKITHKKLQIIII